MHRTAMAIGGGVISVAAHVAIQSTGGYSEAHAPLVIAISAGLIVGSICVGRAWSQRRYAVAVALGVALLAGEAWAMVQTAERVIAQRETATEPARQLARSRKEAENGVEVTRSAIATTSARLDAAITAKASADAAIITEAAKKGCASNCRALLQTAATDAAAEVIAAREELARSTAQQKENVKRAEEHLASLPPPRSETPLADRLGIAGWAFDLITAGLASVAVNGLGAALLAFGAHGPHHVQTSPPQVLTPAEHAARFLLATLKPSAAGSVALSEIHRAYLDWCAKNNLAPLPASSIAAETQRLFDDAKIEIADRGGSMFALGVKLQGQSVGRSRVKQPRLGHMARVATT